MYTYFQAQRLQALFLRRKKAGKVSKISPESRNQRTRPLHHGGTETRREKMNGPLPFPSVSRCLRGARSCFLVAASSRCVSGSYGRLAFSKITMCCIGSV